MSNMALWESVEKTDPGQTKPITGKPYNGTSPKPYYLIRKATETFGPCGIGWGFSIIGERVEDGAQGDKVHIAHVRVWYVWDGKRGEVDHVGQTMFAGKRKDGKTYTDEDAPKKSVTDALVKALSMIGFAGDIFIGRYDDSKYVSELRREIEQSAFDDIADAYLSKAKADIHCFATPGELREWWEKSTGDRERAGVVKGTTPYAELWAMFLETGKRLAGNQQAAA